MEPRRETPSGQEIVVFGALYLKQDIRCALYLKQDIRLYVPYSQPNGWTDWAEIFVDTHGWPVGVLGYKNFFFHWQRWALQLVV